MGKKPVTRAALLGALCLPILPALAQDGGGPLLTFGISQRFETGDNLNLEIPSEGSTTRADTELSFGLLSETQTDRLALDMSGLFRIENTSLTGSDAGFQDPNLRFSYDREGATSSFNAQAYYRESDVNNLQSLTDFVDSSGNVVLPPDFANLSGTGRRTVSGSSVNLELGRETPLGFVLDAGFSQTDYSNTSSSDLSDFDRRNVDGQARLRFSPLTTGTVGLRYDTYDAANPTGRDRTTTAADIGVEEALSERSTLKASLGASQVETDEAGLITTTSGLIGSLGLAYDMPNGSATADFDAKLDENGDQRLEFVVGRSMELPDGSLSARLGLTAPEIGKTEVIGGLDWQRALPDGKISARLNRSVSSSDQDVSRLTTLASINYDHDINAVSGIGLGLLYVQQEGTPSDNQVTRTDLNATYRHALTEDWNVNTGVSYRVRDEDTVGRAESPSVFLSIGRRFDFRP